MLFQDVETHGHCKLQGQSFKVQLCGEGGTGPLCNKCGGWAYLVACAWPLYHLSKFLHYSAMALRSCLTEQADCASPGALACYQAVACCKAVSVSCPAWAALELLAGLRVLRVFEESIKLCCIMKCFAD